MIDPIWLLLLLFGTVCVMAVAVIGGTHVYARAHKDDLATVNSCMDQMGRTIATLRQALQQERKLPRDAPPVPDPDHKFPDPVHLDPRKRKLADKLKREQEQRERVRHPMTPAQGMGSFGP